MKEYKALVKDKYANGAVVTVSGLANSKSEFIHDLRRNGYAVNPKKVKAAEVFDYIVNYTDMREWDWELRRVPVC